MAHARKSLDGRKRARTMEYMDSQVEINDEELSQNPSVHVGQHIDAQFDLSISSISERPPPPSESHLESFLLSTAKLRKSDFDRSFLQRQRSDMSLNRLTIDPTKTTTELKGRDHILRLMKANQPKPSMEVKNHRFVQEMIARRQEKEESTRSISDFALKYGLMDNEGKKIKCRKTSENMMDMAQQLENLKPSLNRRQMIDAQSPLLRVIKIETVCNQLLCYCQYVNDQEDLILFLDPNNEQVKHLAVNDEIRIAGESRLDMNLPDMGAVALGITDVRRESVATDKLVDERTEAIHRYDFHCSCSKCRPNEDAAHPTFASGFDLLSTFPSHSKDQQHSQPVEPVYISFTLALMTRRKFDLRATIIIYEADPMNDLHILIARDGIGNCLQITFEKVDGWMIEIQTRDYIFHQIEYVERISSPKESQRWPYEQYAAPKKLFCFRSIANQVTAL